MAQSPVDAIKQILDYPVAPLRVLGPPGSGKTRLLIERFCVLREKDLDVRILTYTKDSHRRLTEAILEQNSAQFGDDPVVQYTRLADEIIALSGEKRPSLINVIEEQLLLEGVVVERWSAMKSSLRSICRTDRFIQDVLEVIHTLLQNGIGEREVDALTKSKAAGPEVEDVLMLYVAYREALQARNLTTHPGISWDAARLCRNGCPGHSIAGAAIILVEDFQDIDPGQFELLSVIAPPGGSVVVNVFGDPMGSVFGHRGTQARFLLDDFPKRYGGETVHLNARCCHVDGEGPAMDALLAETLGRAADRYIPSQSGGITGLLPTKSPTETAVEEAFSLEVVGDELDEAYTIAARIEGLLLSGQYEPTDIAVITNKKSRYTHILRSAFRQHGIPLDTGGAATGVIDDFVYALLLLLDAPDDDVAIRSVVTSPLFGHLRKEVLGNGVEPRVEGGDVDDRERLREYVIGLAAAIRKREAPEWMLAIVEKCLHPVGKSFYRESNDDAVSVVVNRLLESWNGYAASIKRVGRSPDIRTFVGLSGLFATQAAAPCLLPGTVGLYSCRESKGLYFPVVFVVGCSDLLFPSASDRKSLIPVGRLESLIEELVPDKKVSFYQARTAVKVIREQNHFLYISLSRSTRALHITAPSNFGGDEHPAPCSVLEQTTAKRYRCSTPENDRLPAQIRFARAWTAFGRDGALVEALSEALSEVSPAGAAWHLNKAKPIPITAERKPLSKSTLEMFLACQRLFYYRKLLKIPQDPTAPARLGKLFHSVMEKLGRRFKTKASLQAAVNANVIRQLIDDVIHEDGTLDLPSFMDRSIRHYLEQMIGGILELDGSLEDDYKIRSVEESIPFTYRDFDFTGFVDRIENHAGGKTYIVDFKTGKIAKMGPTHRKYVLEALNDPNKADWQIPFYLWAMRMREGRLPDAFRFMAVRAGEKPFAITLHACSDEIAIPDPARKKRGPESYLLENEIEQIMERAVAIAGDIFSPRPCFKRTVDENPCGLCEFNELCQREKKWS